MPTIYDERFVLDDLVKDKIIYDEHIIRYRLASRFVKGKDVLEIACGSGYGANILLQAGAKRVVAMDIDEDAVALAKEKFSQDGLEFRVGNALKIDLPENSQDVIISFETVEHLEEPEKFLAEAKRVLKPNGIFLISSPNKAVFKNKNPFHVNEYEKSDFEKDLKKYFSFVKIFEQRSAVVSFMDLGSSEDEVIKGKATEALYFVGICSQQELDPNSFGKNVLSLNEEAMWGIWNNKGFRLVNWIYSMVMRVPGVKRIFNF